MPSDATGGAADPTVVDPLILLPTLVDQALSEFENNTDAENVIDNPDFSVDDTAEIE